MITNKFEKYIIIIEKKNKFNLKRLKTIIT
jgi:hypothetical protein